MTLKSLRGIDLYVGRLRSSRGANFVRHPGRNSRHPVCDSVLKWALTTPGIHVERIRPSYTVDRVAPRTIDGSVHPYFASFPSKYVVPEKYLACVPGGRVLGKRGLVVLPDGSFSAESIYDVSQLPMAPEFSERLPTAERYQPGNYYSLPIWGAEIGGRLYWYHWIHDVVLRLHEIVDRVPPDTRFIVPPNRLPVQDELLALAGVGADRLWEWDGSGVLRLENLYFSPPSPPSGIDSPETDMWLRNRVLAAYGLELGPPRRRILVTRRNADYHHIINEPEVEALLQDFGFEVHSPEQYSLKEQVALFASAQVVVGAHGSRHTNILFSPPGLALIDIFPDNSPTLGKSIWSLCVGLGHQYWYMLGDAVPSRTGSSRPDILVPLPEFRKVVDAALGALS